MKKEKTEFDIDVIEARNSYKQFQIADKHLHTPVYVFIKTMIDLIICFDYDLIQGISGVPRPKNLLSPKIFHCPWYFVFHICLSSENVLTPT